MFAIEVKYVNGTFAVTRERWRYVRYDNYGNQVGEGLLQDARRRPPNVQLAEPLAALEQFLASRGQSARMRPVVLLNHPKARVTLSRAGRRSRGTHLDRAAARSRPRRGGQLDGQEAGRG